MKPPFLECVASPRPPECYFPPALPCIPSGIPKHLQSSEWTFYPFIQALYSSPNSLLSNLLEMVCSFGSYSGSLTKNSLLEAAIPFRTFSMSISASVPATLMYVYIPSSLSAQKLLWQDSCLISFHRLITCLCLHKAMISYKRTLFLEWWLPRGRGLGEGWIGSFGLADANWYIQNG